MRLDETIEHSPEPWLFSDIEKLSLILQQKTIRQASKVLELLGVIMLIEVACFSDRWKDVYTQHQIQKALMVCGSLNGLIHKNL